MVELFYYPDLNKYVERGAAWTDVYGIQHLIGWDMNLSDAEIASMGLQKIVDVGTPESSDDFIVSYELSGAIRTWTNTLRVETDETKKLKIKAQLAATDSRMLRQFEMLIDVMIDKNLINENDLYADEFIDYKAIRNKKKELRRQLKLLEP